MMGLADFGISVNGGGPQTGGIDVPGGSTIDFVPNSIVGWKRARWEIPDYPEGWATPAGWTLDGTTGVIYSTAIPQPPQITLPAAASLWGVWMPRLLVNEQIDTDQSVIDGLLNDENAFCVLSPKGQRDIGAREAEHFTSALTRIKQWIRSYQRNLRTIESQLGDGGSSPTGTGYPRIVAGVQQAAAIPIPLDGGATHVTGTLPPGNGGTGKAAADLLAAPDKAVVVNPTGTGYDFADVVDIPALAGNGGKIVAVNAGATALEYVRRGGRTPITFADANIDVTGAPYNLTRDTIAGSILSLSGANATTTRDLTIPRPADDTEAYVLTVEMAVTTNGVRLFHAGGTWTLSQASGGATHHVMVRNGAITVLGPAGVPSLLGIQYVQANGYFGAVPIGTALQVLRVNAAGNGYEFAAAGGGGSPGGADTQVLFNDAGTEAGDAGLTWDKTNNVLTATGAYAVGSGTKHATALIRLPYAATDVVIGAPNNGGTDYPVLHRTSANTWRFGDATGWNTAVYGDIVTFYGASGTTMYAPGGSVVAIELAASANIKLFDGAGVGGGSKVLSVANATTAPTSNPVGGALWYVEGGASKARGSSGTITTFGPAEPHCPTCGRDFATEHRNDDLGEHLAVCLPCLIDTLKDAGIDTKKFAMVDKRGAGKAEWDDNHAKAKARNDAAEAARAEVERGRRMALAQAAAFEAIARDARKGKGE